jgi:hypothetical protein
MDMMQGEGAEVSGEMLDELYLGMLKGMPEVESNSVFMALRAKLVAFYKKYDLYKNQGDLT